MKKNLHARAWWALTPLAFSLTLAGCGGGDNQQDNTALLATIAAINANNNQPAPVADNGCLTAGTSSSVVVGSGDAGDPAAPEPASGYVPGHKLVYAKNYMVVANHPLATRAGCDILKAGGSAVDAAVAVQAVLGLVEPQSSGLGGGAFMLHYDAVTKKVQAYDGRETAPAAATENYLRYVDDVTDQTAPKPGGARASGRSIGTPGAVRMLDIAYQDHGKLPWKDLFGYGITLASDGFLIGGRMATAISGATTYLKRDPEAAAYFLNADGSPKALGTKLKNPAYAQTLSTIATKGANAFYTGDIAKSIVDKIEVSTAVDGSAITPGKTTLTDLANYKAKRRDPVCSTYRDYYVCGMSPPSSGGIAVAQTLGILETFDLSLYKPTAIDLEGGKPTVMGVHLVSEAERLAYADRDKYVADTDFIPLPKGGSVDSMINKPYLRGRASLISPTKSMGLAAPGDLGSVPLGIDKTEEHGTTHFTIVDKQGNVVVMTTTVEASLGSYHMTQGFMLNNQLTDFSSNPNDSKDPSIKVANRVEPGKRPRSTMAPTLVFKKNADGNMGEFVMGTGSPGGGTIIQYVVKTLVGALDWGLDAQQATSLVDFGATNSPPLTPPDATYSLTNVGGEHPNVNTTNDGKNDPLIEGLRALGHVMNFGAQSSGVSTIIRTNVGGKPTLTGGADPRREGIVLGDTFTP